MAVHQRNRNARLGKAKGCPASRQPASNDQHIDVDLAIQMLTFRRGLGRGDPVNLFLDGCDDLASFLVLQYET